MNYLAHGFRDLVHGQQAPKQKPWLKDVVEQNCSVPGSQGAEHREKHQ